MQATILRTTMRYTEHQTAQQRVQPTLLAQPSTWARLFDVIPCLQLVCLQRLPAARLTPTFGGFSINVSVCSYPMLR
jgi:hypothetical protein